METVYINAPVLLERCAQCDEEYLPHELVSVAGALVCEDCLSDYCRDALVIQANRDDFIQENEKAFLTYWFSGAAPDDFAFLGDNPWIVEEDKLEILRDAYQRWKPWHIAKAETLELDFIDNYFDEWEDYLKKL